MYQIHQVVAPRVLSSAWREVRGGKGMWSPSVTMSAVREDGLHQLLGLSADLRSGRYESYRPRTYVLPKANGGTRTIQAYFGRDKLAQRAVLHVLEPLGERRFSPHTYGYRPGCTADMVLSRIREAVRLDHHWLVDLDVRQCFDRIYRPPLLQILKAWCSSGQLPALIEHWCAVGMPDATQPLGLPQGMVLSPFLCNVYLHRFDEQMSAAGIAFVRFADDVLLMCKSLREAQAARDYAGNVLKSLKLELNEEKTAVFRTTRSRRFLGQRLPRLPRGAGESKLASGDAREVGDGLA